MADIIMVWQPIDTAPTDSTAILLWPYQYSSVWEGKADAEVVLGYFDQQQSEWFNPEAKEWFEPTHWMSLPTPPE